MATGVYVRTEWHRSRLTGKKAVSAKDANELGLVCRYGHVGRWSFSKRGKKDPTRHCNECRSHRLRKYNYGLSIENYEQMLQEQNGHCYICKNKRKLSVDHNHATNKVRRLICQHCNLMVGYVESNYMKQFENYVLEFKEETTHGH